MDSHELAIPEYYIVSKSNGKQQIVKYYQKVKGKDGESLYYGYYGINSYHEVVSERKNIRELTDEERKLLSEKKYWSLPQEFYHSHPEDSTFN